MSPVRDDDDTGEPEASVPTTQSTTAATTTDAVLDWSALLSALAHGARTVQALPVGDDDWDFEASLPEFRSALQSTQTVLLQALLDFLDDRSNDLDLDHDTHHNNTHHDNTHHDNTHYTTLTDPLLWEACADACDVLTERVETYLREAENRVDLAGLRHVVIDSQTKVARMLAQTVVMEKPQDVYPHWQRSHHDRREPFVPSLTHKPHATVPLDLTLVPGHGLGTRRGTLHATPLLPDDLVAPHQHVPHPYQHELTHHSESAQRLPPPVVAPPPLTPPRSGILPATWIDTVDEWRRLGERLAHVTEIALDLEAHSYRSFAGMVCLLQLSFRDHHYHDKDDHDTPNDNDDTNDNSPTVHNFLIDTIVLKPYLNEVLLPVLTNPDVVKVLHGADSDIAWLQRDFGLYIVNLFDTMRAARALKFPRASYAYVLQHYVDGLHADKSAQLADWRVRPLPEALQQYAIQDTAYLLDIYDRMRYDLSQPSSPSSIADVLETSRQVCLIRYAGEPFYPRGYRSLLRHRGKTVTDWSPAQERVLATLWDWRDATARQHDESLLYVCPNASLRRLAFASPATLPALQALFQPMPPFVLRYAREVLERIQAARHAVDSDDDDSVAAVTRCASAPVGSSAFFAAPANPMTPSERRADMMSPVLGTEALYQQAGWMTPQEIVTSTAAEDDEDDDAEEGAVAGTPHKPTHRALELHEANAAYRSAASLAPHSLRLGHNPGTGEDNLAPTTRTADGLATVRAGSEQEETAALASAQQTSARIRQTTQTSKNQAIPAVLGLNPSSAQVDDNTDAPTPSAPKPEPPPSLEEEFPIPRSMREIYKVSNRNRRYKKTGSPTPERGATPTTEKEQRALAEAEAFLRDSPAAAYFDESAAAVPKKARRGRESEESVPDAVSKEDDVQFLKEIGWIRSPAHAEALLAQRYGGVVAVPADAPPEHSRPFAMDEAAMAALGILPANHPKGAPAANPFFAGAALTGGALAAQSAKPVARRSVAGPKSTGGRGNGSRAPQERPNKEDGRTHVYRKR